MSWSGSVPHNFHRNRTRSTRGESRSYWNHNVHYQRVILNAVPVGCGAAIDVGCGDGMLARELAARCENVTGIDKDAAMVALARDRDHGGPRLLPGVRYRRHLLWRYSLVWDKPA